MQQPKVMMRIKMAMYHSGVAANHTNATSTSAQPLTARMISRGVDASNMSSIHAVRLTIKAISVIGSRLSASN